MTEVKNVSKRKPVAKAKAIETNKEAIPEKKLIKKGMVTDCDILNVREKPSVKAKVVGTIAKKTIVEISEAESTEDFYKITVISPVGASGYCMKQFITITE